MNIKEDRKKIANHIRETLGGTKENTRIARHHDEKEKSSVDILSCVNQPQKGVTSYSTIGLSEHSIGLKADNKKLRVEIVSAAYSNFNHTPNIIATCAFYIINDNFTCYPGAIFKYIIKLYTLDTKLTSVLMVPPFLWEGKLKNIETSEGIVTFLMAIPISDSEKDYAMENGSEALEKLLEEKKVDIFDYNRQPVV